MQIRIQTFTVHKRFSLTISRGTATQSNNVWLRLEHEGIEGWGEATPFSLGQHQQTTEAIVSQLQQIAPDLEELTPFDNQRIEPILLEAQITSAARAALDIAFHDWISKRAELPLWRLRRLDRKRIVPTSVTVGINSPEAAQQRLRDWLQLFPVKAVKVKLGSPDGLEADRAMLTAVLKDVPADAKVSIDANGGWCLKDAIAMCEWLAEQGITYVEQPLAEGQEGDLSALYQRSPLPIFVDESCFTSRDIPALADRVHGINIKLMKCGGLTEAMRMIHTARACGLQVMFGCYSDSAIANTALANLSSLANHLDLDSHLNLVDDPFTGALIQTTSTQVGCLLPNDLPGLGLRQVKQIS